LSDVMREARDNKARQTSHAMRLALNVDKSSKMSSLSQYCSAHWMRNHLSETILYGIMAE
jgi:hypothetical protein